MYLLDTNVLSELRKKKSGKADANVVAWASRIPVSQLFLSAITVLDLGTGVTRNTADFAACGADLLNPWEMAGP